MNASSLAHPGRLRTFRGSFTALAIAALAITAHAQDYTVVDLGTLGGADAYGNALNDSGVVVGYSYLNTGPEYHAFSYLNSGPTPMTDLGASSGGYSIASGINDTGETVGSTGSIGFGNPVPSNFQAFWTPTAGGNIVEIGTLGGLASEAEGVNNSGTIVGAPTHPAGFFSRFIGHSPRA